ncbi:type III secretion system chaperone SycT [Yersinia pseudotuberculosis]|uniref:type III secretion system chaperone SycT n=1 Tax=Yersinia pseudotuberculosis TaxID=633 RepID=UPI0005AD6243|nr:type III secretion system chaperone SycT [Yersinia pseudotuberculosis]AJK18593.1 chaperone protein sycT [Yersinia pseudotuberculosis str. PA3606]MCE4114330.1 type III secretion system chaperone SycT [Yersinia pseudotuberculosis]MCF1164581.1 type III secretion system chaperone SycT [Yersinia pseudotuberculosis]RYC20238.1 Tir chaperone family protein [Yersinia pseudotuberculosis]UFA63921.1 Type III secretion system chaperone SycT [Yersinia pseudotuberculosis]
MQTTFTELMQQLFLKLGLNHQVNENDVYTFEVDGHIQVLIACYHQQWVQLFSELGADLPTNDNLFGEHWPAHVQGRLDGKPILWSQQSLVGLDIDEMQAWLERFIDDIEQRKEPQNTKFQPNSTSSILFI